MSWDDRIVHTADGGTEAYAIYEVFYDDNGQPEARTERPSYPAGETAAELADDLRWYHAALHQPVLEDTEFGRHAPDEG
jgi:hypothetical protein